MRFLRKGSHNPPEPASAEYSEDLCRKCGLCCHAKVIVGDDVFVLSEHCPYLDPATNLCTIYEHRHELNPQCLTVEQGIRFRAFPADCPYVAGLADYRPPRTDWTYSDLDLARQREAEKDQP